MFLCGVFGVLVVFFVLVVGLWVLFWLLRWSYVWVVFVLGLVFVVGGVLRWVCLWVFFGLGFLGFELIVLVLVLLLLVRSMREGGAGSAFTTGSATVGVAVSFGVARSAGQRIAAIQSSLTAAASER